MGASLMADGLDALLKNKSAQDLLDSFVCLVLKSHREDIQKDVDRLLMYGEMTKWHETELSESRRALNALDEIIFCLGG